MNLHTKFPLNFHCVIIHWNIDIGLNIFLKKYWILTFSAATTSHQFHLNVTRVTQIKLWIRCKYNMYIHMQRTWTRLSGTALQEATSWLRHRSDLSVQDFLNFAKEISVSITVTDCRSTKIRPKFSWEWFLTEWGSSHNSLENLKCKAWAAHSLENIHYFLLFPENDMSLNWLHICC